MGYTIGNKFISALVTGLLYTVMIGFIYNLDFELTEFVILLGVLMLGACIVFGIPASLAVDVLMHRMAALNKWIRLVVVVLLYALAGFIGFILLLVVFFGRGQYSELMNVIRNGLELSWLGVSVSLLYGAVDWLLWKYPWKSQ